MKRGLRMWVGSALATTLAFCMAASMSTRMVPLTDLNVSEGHRQEGGLYGNNSNVPPPAHLAAAKQVLAEIQPRDRLGNPAADGKIGFVSIGMSNTRMEFTTLTGLVEQDAEVSPHVVLVNAAQGSMGSPAWLDPERRREGLNTWEFTARAVQDAGLSPEQVQVAWMKQVKPNPGQWGDFPDHARQLTDQLAQIVMLARENFPNLKVMYLSSRIYAGYANKPLHPEPYAYETAFSIRWLIDEQVSGRARLNYDPARGAVRSPLLLWGPYLWADGANGREIDNLVYLPEDFADDGIHPSDSGRVKVANLMLDYFKTDPLARSWFLSPEVAARTDSPAPFWVIGDIYYVGDRRVSSYLFTSPEGHILIDTGRPANGPRILQNIVELGFNPKDVRYILITHSHPDHLGSAKFLRAQTGAKIGVHAADVDAAERPDPTRAGLSGFEPFPVDIHLAEGDVISVGNQRIHIYHTPGHTPGTVTFGFTVREDGKEYRGAVMGAAGVTVFSPRLLERNVYSGRLEDIIKSLDRLAAMPVEVWLEAHPHKNDTFEKYRRRLQGETPSPFVDPQGWKAYLADSRERAEQLRRP